MDEMTPPRRPPIVTALALLNAIGAALSLLMGAAFLFALLGSRSSTSSAAFIAGMVACCAAVGVAQVACAIGLWTMRPFGWWLQVALASVGLLGIPLGTVIAIAVLVYMTRPGVKLLFSDRPALEFTPTERTQIAAAYQLSAVAIAVAVVGIGLTALATLGIVAAIAIPGLLRARMAGNEAAAIGTLRTIGSGQAAFAATCGQGAYAASLDDLRRPGAGASGSFVDLKLNADAQHGYRIVLTPTTPAAAGTPACNGSLPVATYLATAEPVVPGTSGQRFFAIDERGLVFQSHSPITSPIVESDEIAPVQ